LDSGGLCSHLVRASQLILKAIENEGLYEGERDKSRGGRPRHIHDPGIQQEPQTIDGKTIVERLDGIDNTRMTLKYGLVSGIPAAHYEGTMEVRPKGTGSHVSWSVSYRPDNQAKVIVNLIVSTLLSTGLDALTTRFGSAP
jgi:hypothetical protein